MNTRSLAKLGSKDDPSLQRAFASWCGGSCLVAWSAATVEQ